MSGRFARVPVGVAADLKLGASALRVLIALCSFANKDGRCWPTLGTIGRAAGIDRRNVSAELKKLIDRGWLKRETRDSGAGAGGKVIYVVQFPDDFTCGDMSPEDPEAAESDMPGHVKVTSPDMSNDMPGHVSVTCGDMSGGDMSGHALTEDLFEQTNEQPRNRGKGTRLPANAILPDEWRQWAHQARPDLDPDLVFRKFVRVFTGPDCKRPVKKDWFRAWQNFVEGERANGTNSRPQGQHGGHGQLGDRPSVNSNTSALRIAAAKLNV